MYTDTVNAYYNQPLGVVLAN